MKSKAKTPTKGKKTGRKRVPEKRLGQDEKKFYSTKEKRKVAGEEYDLFVHGYGQEEVGIRLGNRESYIKWRVATANLEAIKAEKRELQIEIEQKDLRKKARAEKFAKWREEMAKERNAQIVTCGAKNAVLRGKKKPTRIAKRKATQTAKKGQRSPVKKSTAGSIFAGASEISMTENKIAVTRSASMSTNGSYSERTTRVYHERTPASEKALKEAIKNRGVKKVTVKLK